MPQRILRTEDIVEILDNRIKTSTPHAQIDVAQNETYDQVLSTLLTQLCNREQKAAIDRTLTRPSVDNPIVLKDDIKTYYPLDDLGEFKNAVATLSDLEAISAVAEGDMRPVLDEQQIYRYNGTIWVVFLKTGTLYHTQLENQNTDPNYQHLTLAELALLQSPTQNHIHANSPDPTLPTQDPDIILKGITSSGSGLVLTDNERRRIPSHSSVDETPFGDGITITNQKASLDGNSIIIPAANVSILANTFTTATPPTPLLRGRFLSTGTLPNGLSASVSYYARNITASTFQVSLTPTGDIIDILDQGVGTHAFGAYLASSANRYVTSIDPRLNTVKNPYITLGLPNSDTTFECTSILDLKAALDAIASGSTLGIKAVEVLPASYPFNNGTVTWTTKEIFHSLPPSLAADFAASPDDTLKIEALASRESIFNFAPVDSGDTAFTITGNYAGSTLVKGITFVIGGTATLGILADRVNTVFEECSFITATASAAVHVLKAVKLLANNCKFIRCNFTGVFVKGIEVIGNDCTIEGCSFDLTDPTAICLEVLGSGCLISKNKVVKGRLVIGEVSDTVLDKNMMTFASSSIVDSGVNTRWLGGLPQDFQQAYIGRRRTVGNDSSYADFRGTTQAPFIAALADPYTTEIEVFEGSFTFSSPVVVPVGKKIKAIRAGTVEISGGECFILSDSSVLDGLSFQISGASGLLASNTVNAEIRNCTSNVAGIGAGVEATSTTNLIIAGGVFSGSKAIKLTGALRAKILSNRFASAISADVDLSSRDIIYADNIEEGSVCALSCSNSLVLGNHFLTGLPTKVNTLNTLWRGNYGTLDEYRHAANNENGIDTIELPISEMLSPLVTTGSYRGTFVGTAAIAFIETGKPTACSLPMKIDARVNPLLGFSVKLYWLAAVYSGIVKWQVSVTFRDRANQEIGTPITQVAISDSSTYISNRTEKSCVVSFPADYGSLLDLSHVSITVRRLGDATEDTLAGIAYLTNVTISLPRD